MTPCVHARDDDADDDVGDKFEGLAYQLARCWRSHQIAGISTVATAAADNARKFIVL